MADKIPGWAVDAALARLGIDPMETTFSSWRDRTYARAVEMVASLIAAHEEAPTDPLLLEARGIVAEINKALGYSGRQLEAIHSGDFCVDEVNAALAGLRRGIELSPTHQSGQPS